MKYGINDLNDRFLCRAGRFCVVVVLTSGCLRTLLPQQLDWLSFTEATPAHVEVASTAPMQPRILGNELAAFVTCEFVMWCKKKQPSHDHWGVFLGCHNFSGSLEVIPQCVLEAVQRIQVSR